MKTTVKKMNLQLFGAKSEAAKEAEQQLAAEKVKEALKNDDPGALAKVFTDFANGIQNSIIEEARSLNQETDSAVLLSRGVRQLTSEERKYYQAVMEAMRTSNPQQALSDLDVVMPITTVDAVFDDMIANHQLLSAINFTNTSGLIEYIVNTNTKQLAAWGTLTATVVKELTSGFKKINMTLQKLSAFIPVAKSMLDLGPAWMDKYVRTVLAEALYFGVEEGIINGTGKDMPIGMNRQVGDGVTVTDGVYPLKDTVPVTSLDPVTYGTLIGGMAIDAKGNQRVVSEVIMIVSPTDYLTKVMPSTTIRAADGTYVNNVFPFPTRVIQSTEIPTGKAILGLANRYFMGIGTALSGKIEHSDEYKFLEDERVYLVKLYGHGEPLDNTAFVYADISGLTPAIQEVTVKGTVSTQEVV
ncbi:phage major capsid protein [Eubacteriaceae bacterium ES2]|nr:phage major capsid protein [Eubacteriaceae bacterium ES2]